VQSHPDSNFGEMLRWRRASALWLLMAIATFFGSFYVWIISGYVLCGTDTSEPVLSDSVCYGGARAISLFVAVHFAPFLVVAIGGPIALRRKSAWLFVVSVLGPAVVLAASYVALALIGGT
jgi:hypothetical protein